VRRLQLDPGGTARPEGGGDVIRRVLVGVDFRQPSLAAARWAAMHLNGASIELAHVLRRPDMPPFLQGLADPVGESGALKEENASRALEGLAETLPGRGAAVCILDGTRHDALARRADEIGADLVVLGRDVADGARGRTLERVVRGVEVPVLAVGAGLAARPERVIVAVDASPLRDGIARWGTRLARLLDVELTLLHVLPEGLGVQVHRLTHAWLCGVHRAAGGEDTRVRTSVVEGAPGPCILAEAKSGSAVVAVGRHGADSAAPAGLGSAVRLVLRAAPGPVLVVPRAEAWRPSLSLLDGSVIERPATHPVSVA
jgi:nucleotide-binding universal stress UspA family protein